MFVRKAAVISYHIEGTQSTLADLLRYESRQAHTAPLADVEEVSSYVAALSHGVKRIQSGFPLSLRLIREIHKILLHNPKGKNKTPGEFRRSQNWIGGSKPGNARFVPPPPDKIMGLLDNFEKFMHKKDRVHDLIKAALIHVQFETIHPFLDGNGRVGRLLITLFLYVKGYLKSPFLYVSLFFKTHRDTYYSKLNRVRKNGDWEGWINFFLEGVAKTAADAKTTLLSIKRLFAADGLKTRALGRAAASAALVFGEFRKKPVLTITELTSRTGLSKPTAISAVGHLIRLGIIKNTSEKKWGQFYSYQSYIDLITPDTDLS
jgi:Fic family protein